MSKLLNFRFFRLIFVRFVFTSYFLTKTIPFFRDVILFNCLINLSKYLK